MIPALAGALAGLAELIPERVIAETDLDGITYYHVQVSVGGDALWGIGFTQGDVFHLNNAFDEAILELACREEVEARGWGWSVKGGQYPGQYVARIYAGKWGHVEAVQKRQDSPAHALALALLAALGAPARAGA